MYYHNHCQIMVPINYLAVFVAAVAAMILGYLWYGPLFGKEWAKLMGWSPEHMEKMKSQGKNKMMRSYGLMFAGSLLMAFVLSHSIVFATTYMHRSGAVGGLEAGWWSWLGFIVPATIGIVLWDGKPWKLWFINAGYFLVDLLLMGVILGVWM